MSWVGSELHVKSRHTSNVTRHTTHQTSHVTSLVHSNLEHALQLRGELTATLRLEFADHHLLAVVRSGLLVEEPPGQVPLVVLLEGVLLLGEDGVERQT